VSGRESCPFAPAAHRAREVEPDEVLRDVVAGLLDPFGDLLLHPSIIAAVSDGLLDAVEEALRREPERSSELHDGRESGVASASFEEADLGEVEASLVAQLHLGEAELLALWRRFSEKRGRSSTFGCSGERAQSV
jgi:hypothetical protein